MAEFGWEVPLQMAHRVWTSVTLGSCQGHMRRCRMAAHPTQHGFLCLSTAMVLVVEVMRKRLSPLQRCVAHYEAFWLVKLDMDERRRDQINGMGCGHHNSCGDCGQRANVEQTCRKKIPFVWALHCQHVRFCVQSMAEATQRRSLSIWKHPKHGAAFFSACTASSPSRLITTCSIV